MENVPENCGEEFQVSSTGKSRTEAKENAQTKADALCKRMKKGCDTALEHPDGGSYKESEPHVTYTSKYNCMSV